MAPGRRGPIPGCKGGVNAAFQMVGHSPDPASESRIARLPCTRYRHSHCPGAPACLADQPRHARGRVAARLGQAAPSPRVRLRPFLQQSGFWCQRRRAICAPMLHLLRRSLTALTRTIHVKSHRTAPETRYAWVGFPAGEVIQDCLVRSRRLELPRAFAHNDLNVARLPIPPRPLNQGVGQIAGIRAAPGGRRAPLAKPFRCRKR